MDLVLNGLLHIGGGLPPAVSSDGAAASDAVPATTLAPSTSTGTSLACQETDAPYFKPRNVDCATQTLALPKPRRHRCNGRAVQTEDAPSCLGQVAPVLAPAPLACAPTPSATSRRNLRCSCGLPLVKLGKVQRDPYPCDKCAGTIGLGMHPFMCADSQCVQDFAICEACFAGPDAGENT